MRLGVVAATLPALFAAIFAIGCGDREFTAGEFVGSANEEGAALALGEVVTTNDAGERVYAVEFAPDPDAEANPQLHADGHGRGTMIVADDSGRAGDEFDRCEQTADLTCFRAANVVLRFEEMDPADRARISGALSALASEG